MTARPPSTTGRAAAETALLARLGLPPSTTPEDLDELHEAVSEYLAAAPAEIRGWAHAQATSLDETYLQLTDPVGLEGSTLRSPTRPSAVDPGGPATPPARRATVPAVTTPVDDGDAPDEATDEDDLDALIASVTPSAHRDSLPSRRSRKASRPKTTAGSLAASQGRVLPWRRIALGGVAIVAAVLIAIAGYSFGGGTGQAAGAPTASNGAPAIDQAKVADLMARIQASPNDTATLLALADEFYAGGQYQVAGTWLDKVLALDAKNVQALLAKGAVSFDLGDMPAAETTWKTVLGIETGNVEAHYDLGFLYLNQSPPDLTGVQREWTQVVKLGPGTQLAQTVQAHLDSLAAASMLPSGSADGSAAPSSPATSPAASGSAPAASPAPAATPAPSASSQP